MRRHPLLSGPLLAALLLLAAAEPPAAYSAGPGARAERGELPRERPDPEVDDHRTRCPVCRAAERAGLRITPLVTRPITRCMPREEPLTATLPRGRVRSEDLETLRLDVGLDVEEALPGFLDAPHVDVRCGDTPLGRVPFSLEYETVHVDVPVMLRAKLEGLRGAITWGRAGGGGQALATIWLDPPSVAERRARADLDRALGGEPRWIRRVVEAQLLLDQAFDVAALRAAQEILRTRPREPHAAAVLNAAYGLMGLGDLPEAYEFNAAMVRDLREERRRRQAPTCHLDDVAAPLRSREKRPVGGCGQGR